MVDLLESVGLAILTLIIGLVVGYELGRICERLVRASARSRRMNDDAAEPIPGDSPARTPGAEPVKRPFADRDDNSGGHRTDNGDDDGFHAAILPQKQEAGK